MPILTPRLSLRLFVPEDFASLRQLDSDPVVLRFRSRKAISEEETQAFLEKAQRSIKEFPRRYYAYAVTLRNQGNFLGQCGMTATDTEAHECFLWYSLLPVYWSNGYMTEAVGALVWAGFVHFGLRRVFAESDPANLASIRVMEKIGLHPLEEFRMVKRQRGRKTVVHYELNAGELMADEINAAEVQPPI